MRRAVAAISTVFVAALLGGIAVPASADHTPSTPDYNVVDGVPICGVEGAAAEPPASPGGRLSVGSYNILHSQDEDDVSDVSERFDLIVDAIEAADADVWGLQEVTNDAEHGNQAELIAAELAARTGETWEWCWSWSSPHFPAEPEVFDGGGGPLSELTAQFSKLPEGDLSGFKEGLAVVSRYDIDEAAAKFRRLQPRSHEALACDTPTGDFDPIGCQFPAAFDHRQVLHVPVTTIGGGAIDLFNTHLAHGLTDHSDETKYHQIEKALDIIDEWATAGDGLPTYFTGDFNTDASAPDDGDSDHDDFDRYGLLTAAGFLDTYAWAAEPECGSQADTTVGCTSSVEVVTAGPSQDPSDLDSRIDFVWLRPDGWCGTPSGLISVGSEILGTNTRVLDGGDHLWPSDHLGVASRMACGGPEFRHVTPLHVRRV